MKRSLAVLLLALLAAGVFHTFGGPQSGIRILSPETPRQEHASQQAYQAWAFAREARTAYSPDRRAAGPDRLPLAIASAPAVEAMPSRVSLPLPDGRRFEAAVGTVREHPNGDISLVAGNAGGERALITLGRTATFARIRSDRSIWQVVTDRTGSWMIDLSDTRLEVDAFGGDAVAAYHSAGTGSGAPATPMSAGTEHHDGSTMHRIDVMFLHTPEMSERYPGTMLETRLNHLVAIANQALVDSQVAAQVRLVHHEQTRYARHQSNSEALQDLRDAAAGQLIPGLPGFQGRRAHHGADLVVLTWPHDIETRGACGIAYYPQIDEDGEPRRELGVQITNDGQSNWSVCSDAVFAHELGHNLGAQHQRSTINSPDPQARNFAWTRSGRWHTVMGSYGTGHDDRYLRLDVFSNPSIRCGGEPCGSTAPGNGADNAGHMSGLAPAVAAYYGRDTRVGQHPEPSDADQDEDGRPDRVDAHPFDPRDGVPPAEPHPGLDFSPRRLATPENADDWELLVVSSGNDRVLSWGLDGRFRGVVAEPQAVGGGPVLTAYSDLLVDDAGRLYLLASEDVRRFDRLSGRLIDVHLDSGKPEPRTLQSPFPRAMQWFGSERLVVLGDFAIEIYDRNGAHLNAPSGSERTDEPQSWRDPTDLPLRAAAAKGGRLFVAEAGQDRIMRFSGDQGIRGADVAGPGEGGLSDPRDMVLGPDGLLYVANGNANNVLRFDPARNAYVDTFIPAGRGGLAFARALAFGPGGDLFVVSRDTNAVLRFNGETGAFIDTAANDRSGPLDSPQAIVIAPVIDQTGPGHSGHYFVPSRGGEGWLLEILDEERAAISWFTYPPADAERRAQAWLVGVGRIAGNRIVFDDMLATRLIDADSPIESENIEMLPWGSLTLEFGHCGHGRASFDSPLFGASGELSFVRLLTIAGLPCGSAPQSPSAEAPGISGQWNDPDSSGQGWFFQELGDGRVFTAWFTYDDTGEQAWVVGEGELEGRRLVFEDLILTGGTAFGADFDPAAVDYRSWGRLELTFESCNRAIASYESQLPGFGRGELAPERLTRLASLECDLEPPEEGSAPGGAQ